MKTMKNNEALSPWYKEPYVWLIIFLPALAVFAGVITIILAVQTDDGLVVDDYYKKGLEINRTLERDHIASEKQLKADIKYDAQGEEILIILTAVSDFDYPEILSVSFLHATRSGFDKEAKLVLIKDNTYRGNLSLPSPGKWYVHIQHDNWRLINTINITNRVSFY